MSCRTSSGRLGVADRWSVMRAVCGFELRLQQREPATYLYPLVFFLLSFAFASSSTVELVSDEGALAALPALAPLSVALAMGGLSAFGQVITTMISASAFLRDAAVRADGLLFSTPVSLRSWVAGRLLAVWVVIALVYGSMVLGLVVGSAMPWLAPSPSVPIVLGSAARAWLAITLPSSIAVATLLALVAVRVRRLLAVLAAALALLFLWQGCESVIARVPATSAWATAAALLDPFGTTALQVVTGNWSDAERAVREVPLRGLVLGSRALWLAVAAVAGAITLRTSRLRMTGSPSTARTRTASGVRAAAHAPIRHAALARAPGMHAPLTRAAGARWSQLRSIAVFTGEWLWRDRGWQVIAALGAANVLIQSVGSSSAGGAVEVVLRVQEHARLFLILLATVYAGELLWRDPDGRVVQLVHASPVANGTLVSGRVLGVVASQGALIAALLLASWLGGALHSAALGAGTTPPIGATVGIGVLWLWLPFAQWMVLSLAVHVFIRHKVMAHLGIIATWVLAFTLNANGVRSPWLRVADPPPLVPGEPLALAEALWRAAGWSALCAAALAYCAVRWRAATSPR